jgi:hypothetical protein
MNERWSVARMVLLAGLCGICFYVLNQVLRYSDWNWCGYIATIAWVLSVFALALSQPLYFWGKEKVSDSPWVERIQITGYLAIHYVSDILTLVMLRDLIGFPIWAGAEWGFWNWNGIELYSGTGALVILFLPFVLLGLGYLIVRFGPFAKKVKVVDPRLPDDLDGFCIAQMSDIHLGPMMSPRLVENILKELDKLKFDILVMTGDIIDCDAERYRENVDPIRKLSAPQGVYFCPGNHEYYWDLERSIRAIREAGYKVLINEAAEIQRGQAKLRLWGVPDPIAKYFPGVRSLEWDKVTPKHDGAYEVLLAHQPHLADQAKEKGFHLQLSGHTHSGQFFPWNFLIVFFQKYSKGLYHLKAKNGELLHLYVNQGTGFWGPPTRLGTYSEITLITLRRPR